METPNLQDLLAHTVLLTLMIMMISSVWRLKLFRHVYVTVGADTRRNIASFGNMFNSRYQCYTWSCSSRIIQSKVITVTFIWLVWGWELQTALRGHLFLCLSAQHWNQKCSIDLYLQISSENKAFTSIWNENDKRPILGPPTTTVNSAW